MENLELLFKRNPQRYNKICINKNCAIECEIVNYRWSWSGNEIRQMIAYVNSILIKYSKVKPPVHFVLRGRTFIDKLTYIFVECICLYLIEHGFAVQIYMSVESDIGVEGIVSSPLLLLNNTKLKSVKLFPVKFNKDLYGNHFRKLIGSSEIEKNIIGNIYTEVDSFLKPFNVSDEFRNKVSLTVAELVGNATEHAKTDCLIDIDVTTPYSKRGDVADNEYYGVNIAVVNFSEKLLGDDIYKKLFDNFEEITSGRYKKVLEAYEYHKTLFNEQYGIEDFCNIATFQHKISGRADVPDGVGGTGLTKLIQALQIMSEAYRCYVISGKRCVNFDLALLEYDKDGWIGFNDVNSFTGAIPNDEVTTECFIDMPGTAYNLTFVTKGEKQYGRESNRIAF